MLLDAFVVRIMILPSAMLLLGDASWWPGRAAVRTAAASAETPGGRPTADVRRGSMTAVTAPSPDAFWATSLRRWNTVCWVLFGAMAVGLVTTAPPGGSKYTALALLGCVVLCYAVLDRFPRNPVLRPRCTCRCSSSRSAGWRIWAAAVRRCSW
ncbi:hypothetical protein [Streptomyces sp. NPDC014006]|uniref:hypothetical protein n=1 Tax=Streptomyces sp. NPDC014006 TaxID=3364870 RepID=UPI0036FE545E